MLVAPVWRKVKKVGFLDEEEVADVIEEHIVADGQVLAQCHHPIGAPALARLVLELSSPLVASKRTAIVASTPTITDGEVRRGDRKEGRAARH